MEYAADDFAHIAKRLEELRKEREAALNVPDDAVQIDPAQSHGGYSG